MKDKSLKHKQDFSIDHLAALSRLKLTAREKQAFQKQFREILSYIGQLNQIKGLDKVNIIHQIGELKNVARSDRVKAGLSFQQIKQNAPSVWRRYIKTTRVLNKENN